MLAMVAVWCVCVCATVCMYSLVYFELIHCCSYSYSLPDLCSKMHSDFHQYFINRRVPLLKYSTYLPNSACILGLMLAINHFRGLLVSHFGAQDTTSRVKLGYRRGAILCVAQPLKLTISTWSPPKECCVRLGALIAMQDPWRPRMNLLEFRSARHGKHSLCAKPSKGQLRKFS